LFIRRKIGLALGGGGARGLAHIGVLRVLEKEKIPISIISGTSAGSIIGAMFAQNPSIWELEEKIRDFFESKEYKRTGVEHVVKKNATENLFSQITENLKERIVINIACSRKSLVKNKRFKTALDYLIDEGDILHTKIKFGVAASDLVTGKSYFFKRGDIRQAVLASSSIPGFLPPVEINNHVLLDGVITDPVPIRLAFELGANFIIAVNVSPDLAIQHEFDNIIEIVMRNNQMVGDAYNYILMEKADVVIRPKVGNYHWSEFNHIDKIIHAGEEATYKVLPHLKRLTKKKFFR